MKYDKIGCAEYGIYLMGEGKLQAYKTTPQGPTLSAYDLPTVTDVSAGMHNAGVIAGGKAWFVFKPSNTGAMTVKEIPQIINPVSVSGLGNSYVFLCFDGSAWVANENGQVAKIKTVGKPVKAMAGWNLFIINDAGEGYEYPWSRGAMMPAAVAALIPTKLVCPPIQGGDASNGGFAVLLCDGVPYGYGYNWGMIGMTAGSNNPVDLRKPWNVTKKILTVDCSEEATHFIDADNDLFGLGSNIQGEVGNNTEAPYTLANKRTDGNPAAYVVKAPVQLRAGRKYDKICKGDTLAYYAFAREINGTWNFWGRIKAGVSGTGVFGDSHEDLKPNWGDILLPWRVGFPALGHIVSVENPPADWLPAEVVVGEPEPPIPPVKKLVGEFTTQLNSLKAVHVKQYSDDTAEVEVIK
jgi:hypothetical protein